MDKDQWKRRYTDHLVERYGFVAKEAAEMAEAGTELYWQGDFSLDAPEDAADEEMTYWGD